MRLTRYRHPSIHPSNPEERGGSPWTGPAVRRSARTAGRCPARLLLSGHTGVGALRRTAGPVHGDPPVSDSDVFDGRRSLVRRIDASLEPRERRIAIDGLALLSAAVLRHRVLPAQQQPGGQHSVSEHCGRKPQQGQSMAILLSLESGMYRWASIPCQTHRYIPRTPRGGSPWTGPAVQLESTGSGLNY